MKYLPNFSVKRPVAVVMGVLITILLGIISLLNLTTELLPNINLPYMVVTTAYPGSNPELVENNVTKPIESSLSKVSDIKNISSVSNENYSLVILEFNDGINIDSSFVEVRENLDMLKNYLPEEVKTPTILKLNPNIMPIMQLGISFSNLTLTDNSILLKKEIVNRLESIPGVASVDLEGLVQEIIGITLNQEKIDSLNEVNRQVFQAQRLPYEDLIITDSLLKGIITGQNLGMPIGFIEMDKELTLVRLGDKIKSLEELENLMIINNPLMKVKVKDIADVTLINNADKIYSKINGENTIVLSFQKQNNYPTSEVVKNIYKRLDQIKEEYPQMETTILLDQARYINMTIDNVLKNLIYGGLLAILVLLFFLKNIKPTIVISLAIPISVITTFMMIYFSGITLNIISLGGLALGVGMLVDNAIVVIENIFRLRREGLDSKEASIVGASQVSGAITASTLTTVSVFVPILFIKGLVAEIFKQMALTVSFSLLASLIVALTLVPMISSKILIKEEKDNENLFKKFLNSYEKLLKTFLHFKYLVVIFSFLLFIGSIILIPKIGTEFIPTEEEGNMLITVDFPKDVTFKDKVESYDELMNLITPIKGIETIAITLNDTSFNLMGLSNDVYVLIDEEEFSFQEIEKEILKKTKNFNYDLVINSETKMANMMNTGIKLKIKGEDFEELRKISNDVISMIEEIKGISNIGSSIDEGAKELKITVDKDKSIQSNLTNYNVFDTLNKMINTNYKATTIDLNYEPYDVYVYPSNRNTVSYSDLKEALLEEVFLKEIASFNKSVGFTSINRDNQSRYISVSTEILDGYNIGKISQKIKEKIDHYNIKEGYEISFEGEVEEMETSLKALFQSLILAVLLIYMVMAIQFESLLYPFIVLFTVPLAFTGSLLALYLTNTSLSVVSLIGIIILAGIVVNNAIVLVDYINQLKEKGSNVYEALIEAGKVRMRPILMTSLTTILALIILAIGIGEGTVMMRPMAIATIGGLLYATPLTLGVIPCLYLIINKFRGGKRNEKY